MGLYERFGREMERTMMQLFDNIKEWKTYFLKNPVWRDGSVCKVLPELVSGCHCGFPRPM